jgi:hypothetical protein
MTELLPPSNPVIRAYTYTVYHNTSSPALTTVLAVCQLVAKETLKEHYKRLQSDPSASGEYSFVYENVSEVLLQNNQMLVLDVEANEILDDDIKVKSDVNSCGTLQSETTGETND